MASINELDVFEYIERHADPYVTLTQINANFGDSSKNVRLHLGSLYRKNQIMRQDGPQVKYWTAKTNDQMVSAGIKASVVEVTPTEAPVAPPTESPTEPPTVAPTQTPEPLGLSSRGAPGRAYINPNPPMATLQKDSTTGKIGIGLWRIRNESMAALSPYEIRDRFCPDMDHAQVRGLIGYMIKKGVLTNETNYPRTGSRHRWDLTRFKYPFKTYLPEDDPAAPKQATIVNVSVGDTESDKQYAEDERECTHPEGCKFCSWCGFDIRDNDAEPAVTEPPTQAPTEPPVVEPIDEEPEDDVEQKMQYIDPNISATEEDSMRAAINAASSITPSGHIVNTEGVIIGQFDCKLRETFDVSISSRGTVTIEINGNIVALDRDKSNVLLSVIGPHYNPAVHKLFGSAGE